MNESVIETVGDADMRLEEDFLIRSDEMEEEDDSEPELIAVIAAAATLMLLLGKVGPLRGRKPPRLPWEKRLCYLDLTERSVVRTLMNTHHKYFASPYCLRFASTDLTVNSDVTIE